jgi:hypothetical protein
MTVESKIERYMVEASAEGVRGKVVNPRSGERVRAGEFDVVKTKPKNVQKGGANRDQPKPQLTDKEIGAMAGKPKKVNGKFNTFGKRQSRQARLDKVAADFKSRYGKGK